MFSGRFLLGLLSLISCSAAQSAVPKQKDSPSRPDVATASGESSIVVSGPGRAGGKLNGNFAYGGSVLAPTFIPAPTVVAQPSPIPDASLTCKTVIGDNTWPDFESWNSALPGVVPVPYSGRDAHPNYFLAAKSIEDVQRAVRFASLYNIRLSVIASGLDYLGRSDAPNGLLLSVKRLKGVQVLPKYQPTSSGAAMVNFVSEPSSANVVQGPASSDFAVSIGAGVTTQELNDALEPSELFTMGPTEGSVAVAGGWSQGAGHGPLTGFYGLGADNILEYRVVTADGQVRVANAASNADLFWALRGGGGGTFAVVVQATIRAYPSPRVAVSSWWLNSTVPANREVYKAAAYLHSQIPTLGRVGVQGYYYVYQSAIHGVFLSHDRTATDMQQLLKPTLAKLQSFPRMGLVVEENASYINYKEFYDNSFGMLKESSYDVLDRCRQPLEFLPTASECQNITRITRLRRWHQKLNPRTQASDVLDPSPAGRTTLDSWLLADVHLTDGKLADAIERSMPRGDNGNILMEAALRSYFTLGAGVRGQPDTSYHPAWRRASALVVSINVSALRAFQSNMASSLDEGYWNASNWKSTFWGENYDRLHDIKLKYDPKHLFYASPGVGADAWVVDASRLCRKGLPDSPLIQHWGNDTVPLGDNQNPPRNRAFPSFIAPWPEKQLDADSYAKAHKQRLNSLRAVSATRRQSPELQSSTSIIATPTILPDWTPDAVTTPRVQFTPVPGEVRYAKVDSPR